MKVGIDSRGINLYSGSGIGTYTKNLVYEMINNSKDTNFDLIWTGKEDSNFIKSNTKLFFASGKHGGFYEKCYIPNLMQKERVDLYHIPQNGIGFPFNWDLNTIVTIHDLIPYTMPETVGKGYLERFLKDMPNIISSTKGILTVSEYSKKDILKFFPSFPEEDIIVTPLAANSNFKPIPKDICENYIKSNFNISDPYILYIGGFSKRKNVEGLIRAFSNIYKNFSYPCKLLLCGSLRDEGNNLKELVYSLGLSEEILFTGYINDIDLPILYSAAEVFVYPSFYEGFGLPPLEAMSCNTPVITSNLTSIPEVTKDSALLIDPNNTSQLEEALLKVIEDKDFAKILGKKGYIESQNFSWQNTAQKTLEAYKYFFNKLSN